MDTTQIVSHRRRHRKDSQRTKASSEEKGGERVPHGNLRERDPSSKMKTAIDELAYDVPMEQQKSGLSRRTRSAHPIVEVIHRPTREEGSIKARAKRRKTTGSAHRANTSPSPENIDILEAMGITPRNAKKALQKSDNNLKCAVDLLFNSDSFDDTSPKMAVTASDRIHRSDPANIDDRTAVNVEIPTENTEGREDANKANLDDQETEHNVQALKAASTAHDIAHEMMAEPVAPVVAQKVMREDENEPFIPRRKARPKPKRSKTVPVVIEVSDSEDEGVSAPVETKPKTTGRKGKLPSRKKPRDPHAEDTSEIETEKQTRSHDPAKNENTMGLSTETAKESNQSTVATAQDQPKQAKGRRRKKSKTSMNVTLARDLEEVDEQSINTGINATQSAEDPQSTMSQSPKLQPKSSASVRARSSTPLPPTAAASASSSPTKQLAPPAETSPSKVVQAKASAHSPINKSKVPYRVGLSKKARIAPLLRVMKK
jgi:hypothetical protein